MLVSEPLKCCLTSFDVTFTEKKGEGCSEEWGFKLKSNNFAFIFGMVNKLKAKKKCRNLFNAKKINFLCVLNIEIKRNKTVNHKEPGFLRCTQCVKMLHLSYPTSHKHAFNCSLFNWQPFFPTQIHEVKPSKN